MVTYVDAATAPLKNTGQIRLYDREDFAGMKKASDVTARCLDALVDLVKPGVTTQEIDDFVFEFGLKENAVPATLNYRGFTKSTCTSINHVVCHGIPNEKPLKEGDIVNVDVTYIVDGWYGDSSRMYPVGKLKRAAERLVDVTYESLLRGIEAAKPGNTTGDIGAAIQTSHAFFDGIASSNDQDRTADPLGTQGRQYIQAITSGEIQIEQNGIESLGHSCFISGFA